MNDDEKEDYWVKVKEIINSDKKIMLIEEMLQLELKKKLRKNLVKKLKI